MFEPLVMATYWKKPVLFLQLYSCTTGQLFFDLVAVIVFLR
jgi:hypothetical protein